MIETIILKGNDCTDIFQNLGINHNEISHALKLVEKDEVIGFSLFDMDNESILIKYLSPDNFSLFDGVLRSTLFIAANKGIMKAFWGEKVDSEKIKKLGFCGNEERREIDITNLFSSCCCS